VRFQDLVYYRPRDTPGARFMHRLKLKAVRSDSGIDAFELVEFHSTGRADGPQGAADKDDHKGNGEQQKGDRK
jgi:hypothetical protein